MVSVSVVAAHAAFASWRSVSSTLKVFFIHIRCHTYMATLYLFVGETCRMCSSLFFAEPVAGEVLIRKAMEMARKETSAPCASASNALSPYARRDRSNSSY